MATPFSGALVHLLEGGSSVSLSGEVDGASAPDSTEHTGVRPTRPMMNPHGWDDRQMIGECMMRHVCP